jgi:hypothetical protein
MTDTPPEEMNADELERYYRPLFGAAQAAEMAGFAHGELTGDLLTAEASDLNEEGTVPRSAAEAILTRLALGTITHDEARNELGETR